MIYKKRALLISGGGSWGALGGGTLARLDNRYDTIIGTSTGALLAPFVALRQWEQLKFLYTTITKDNIFDNTWYKPSPFNKKGQINTLAIIISLLLKQKSVATSRNLRNTIDNFFSLEMFNKIKEEDIELLVGTLNYSETPAFTHYFSSYIEKYEDFKDWMWCSANFPMLTTLVSKGWHDKQSNYHVGLWGDGGLIDLIGINKLINKKFTDVDIILHRAKIENKLEGNKINNLIEFINLNIRVMRYDIEFQQLYKSIKELNNEGANVNIYWMPYKIDVHPMIFNNKLMSKWWEDGYNTALNPNRVENFPSKKR